MKDVTIGIQISSVLDEGLLSFPPWGGVSVFITVTVKVDREGRKAGKRAVWGENAWPKQCVPELLGQAS